MGKSGGMDAALQMVFDHPALALHLRRLMAIDHLSENLADKLRTSRERLERQIEEGKASCDTQEVLNRIDELRKGSDDLDDTLIQHGQA